MTAKQIELQIENILQKAGIEYSAKYVGENENPFNSEKSYTMDAWKIVFSKGNKRFSLDYFTGVGLRKKAKIRHMPDTPIMPHPAGVLYSVVMDSEACEMSFDDWCSELGYDTDSRKALETYLACQNNGAKYAMLFDSNVRQEIAEILQDY